MLKLSHSPTGTLLHFCSGFWTIMASWLLVLHLFFCFVSSDALYENVSYHDIMLNVAKLQKIAAQQRDLDNPANLHPPFDDGVLQMISSPWKLLQNGSKISRKLNNAKSVSAYCEMAIEDTVAALAKGEGWAGRSKCIYLRTVR